MFSKLLAASALALTTSATFGFFECKGNDFINGLSTFDPSAFAGKWYEVTKDSTLRTWSGVECATDDY